MLDLLLLPFELAWALVKLVWGLVTGAVSLVFGLLGGAVSLMIGVATIILLAGLIATAVRRRSAYKKAREESDDFISYYDQNAVK